VLPLINHLCFRCSLSKFLLRSLPYSPQAGPPSLASANNILREPHLPFHLYCNIQGKPARRTNRILEVEELANKASKVGRLDRLQDQYQKRPFCAFTALTISRGAKPYVRWSCG